MTVGELLALLGVKDPKAVADSLDDLSQAARPVLRELAAWGQRLTSAMKSYAETMSPEMRTMLEGLARAQAQGGDAPSVAPWWTRPEMIFLPPDSTADASDETEVARLSAQVDELQAKMAAMEARAGRPIPGLWTHKKDSDDDPS